MADSAQFDWPPLESNPEIFTEYMHKVGLSPSLAVGEVFGFDEELLAFLPQPVHAVIVNFERLNKAEDKALGNPEVPVDFYMKQSGTLDNACGVIACLHSVFNTPAEIADGSVLAKFKAATAGKTPEERCAALETDTSFKEQHASFASQGQSEAVTSDQSKVKHHFVAFVVKGGKLIELDGTKRGPNVIGDSDDVLRGSIKEIQRRLAAARPREPLG